jgi:hypothetical protein
VVGIVALAAAASTAHGAAKLPVYRDPPGYAGVRKSPTTKPAPIVVPPPIALSPLGSYPAATVDAAGTAHIVWNENRGDAADVVVYCRLKRGASACDSRTELTWDKSYDSGDDPAFNSGDPPKIVQVGDQLVVLQHRYPTYAKRPDDSAGSENVLEWTSSDGGTQWAGPALVGVSQLDSLLVFGPADDTTILNFGIDPYCGPTGSVASACVQAYRAGRFSTDEAQLGTVQDANYYPSVAPDAGLPLTALADLKSNVYLRRWTGTGSITDPATWGAPTVLAHAEEPELAGGPGGTWLLTRGELNHPYAVRAVTAGGTTFGPPVKVSTGGGDAKGRIVEDEGGHLLTAWYDGDALDTPGKKNGLVLRTSSGGARFAAAQRLATGQEIEQINLAAAGDAGGFAVFNRSATATGEGVVTAAGFGSQKATGKPGLGALPGGSGVVPTGKSCDVLDFGRFKIDSAQGCFLRGTGSSAGVFVTNGEIDVWGVRIVPDDGCRLIIDPKLLKIDTLAGCGARVIVTAPLVGDVVLWHGEIHRDLSAVQPGQNLFEFPSGEFRANILGFDVGADIKVRLEKDGVHIPVDLQLPPAFGGFSGHAELVSTPADGLQLSSLHLHIGPVPLGVLVINSMDLDYDAETDSWTGAGSLTVPAGGTLAGSATFSHGAFKGAEFDYTPTTPLPVGPFVYLLTIGGGFHTDPTHIEARASFGAGVAVDGEAPIKIDGRFDMIFPPSGPASFKLSGSVSVFFIHVGDGYLRFETDGYADFGGHVGFDLGPLTFDANTDGFVDAGTGDFGVSVDGEVGLCVDFAVEVCANVGGATAINNVGFAACVKFLGATGGIEYPWKDFDPVAFVNPFVAAESIIEHLEFPCSTSAYHSPPPRPQRRSVRAAGGTTVDVAGGLPSKTILLRGDGAAPSVTVSGPGGTFDTEHPGPLGMVIRPKNVNASYVLLEHPKAGAWTVTPEAGSAAITQVMVSEGYVPATVHATLAGRGRRHTIAYRIANPGHGQSVQFVERGAFGGHVLGSVTKARGTLRFTAADAKGGRRTVYALVEHAGIASAQQKVGSYVAPGPVRPGPVRALRARRRGTSVIVTWRPAARSARSIVRLRGRDTRLGRLVGGKVRRVGFAGVRRGERVTVTVQGVSRKLRTGPMSSRTLGGPS